MFLDYAYVKAIFVTDICMYVTIDSRQLDDYDIRYHSMLCQDIAVIELIHSKRGNRPFVRWTHNRSLYNHYIIDILNKVEE